MDKERKIKETAVTDGYDTYLDFSLRELLGELQKDFTEVKYCDNSYCDDVDNIVLKGAFGYINLEKCYGGTYQRERALKIEIIGISERDNTSRLIKDYYIKKEVEEKIYKNYLTGAIKFIKENIHIIDDELYFTNGMK